MRCVLSNSMEGTLHNKPSTTASCFRKGVTTFAQSVGICSELMPFLLTCFYRNRTTDKSWKDVDRKNWYCKRDSSSEIEGSCYSGRAGMSCSVSPHSVCTYTAMDIYSYGHMQLYTYTIMHMYSYAHIQICTVCLHTYRYAHIQLCTFIRARNKAK